MCEAFMNYLFAFSRDVSLPPVVLRVNEQSSDKEEYLPINKSKPVFNI